jgi:hypothetical protein
MASYNYKDKGKIIKFGGGNLAVREVSDAGVYSAGDDYNLGYINDVGIKFETAIEDIKDETGSVVASLESEDTVKLEGVFMQTGKDLIEFLRDKTVGKFYQLYYKMTPTNQMNGTTQEIFAGIVKIKRMIDVKANTKRIPFEMTILNNDAAISITTPNTVFGSVTTATVTIDANTYFEIVET